MLITIINVMLQFGVPLTDNYGVIIYNHNMLYNTGQWLDLLQLGKCNIEFFKFRHRQVKNFKILNHFKRD